MNICPQMVFLTACDCHHTQHTALAPHEIDLTTILDASCCIWRWDLNSRRRWSVWVCPLPHSDENANQHGHNQTSQCQNVHLITLDMMQMIVHDLVQCAFYFGDAFFQVIQLRETCFFHIMILWHPVQPLSSWNHHTLPMFWRLNYHLNSMPNRLLLCLILRSVLSVFVVLVVVFLLC